LGLLIAHPARAATVPITNTLDSGAGSLRQAVMDANEGDTIIFDSAAFSVPLTITLATGQVEISKSLTIDGAANGVVTPTVSGGNANRVFEVGNGVAVTLSRVRVVNGNCVTAGCVGGGIANFGHLTVAGSAFLANQASGGCGGAVYSPDGGSLCVSGSLFVSNTASQGGAICNGGLLSVVNSMFIGNSAGAGGAILNGEGVYYPIPWSAVVGSTFLGNSASNPGGGGILNTVGLTVVNSTFVGNSASMLPWYGSAGGAFLNINGSAVLSNTTLVGNSSDSGGAVWNAGFTIEVDSSTFSGNVARGNGGAIGNRGAMTFRNTIIARSSGGDCSLSFASPLVDGGHNLDTDGSCGFSAPGSLPGTDPQLGSLGDYGGPVPTIPLLPGSPAHDAGDDAACPPTDARGAPRPFGAHCDIGVYEAQNIRVVTRTEDGGPGSLRQAVLDAADSDTIIFSREMFSTPLTVTLTGGQIELTKSLTLDGAAGGVVTPTISGNGASRVLSVTAGVTVTLSGLRLTGGLVCSYCNGGAVYNAGTLTLRGTELLGNRAGSGGALYNTGVADVADSTIAGNTGTDVNGAVGGGIYNAGALSLRSSLLSNNGGLHAPGGGLLNAGRLIVIGTTFVSNTAGLGGGALIGGPAWVTNSTFVGNSAGGAGALLVQTNGDARIFNSTFAGNSAQVGGGLYNIGGLTVTNSLVADSPKGENCVTFAGHVIADGGTTWTAATPAGLPPQAR
jgi:hypothetical protein